MKSMSFVSVVMVMAAQACLLSTLAGAQAHAAYDCRLKITETIPVRTVEFKMQGKPDLNNLPKEAIVSEQVLNPQFLNEKQAAGGGYSSGPDGVSSGTAIYTVSKVAAEDQFTIQESCGFENAKICSLNIEGGSFPAGPMYMNMHPSQDRTAKITLVGAHFSANLNPAKDTLSLDLGAVYSGIADDAGAAQTVVKLVPGAPIGLSVTQGSHKVANQTLDVRAELDCAAK